MTTHSGQGPEPHHPAARPAHEGVVLPGDGSEPWVPGDRQDGPQGGRQGGPAGGQPWAAGGDPQPPYGHPSSSYGQQPPQGPPSSYGQQPAQGYGYPPAQPAQGYGYPPQQPQGYGYPPPAAQQGYGYPQPPAAAPSPYGQQPPQSPPSPYGQQPPQPPQGYGYPPAQSEPPSNGAQPLPPEAAPSGAPQRPAGGDADATQYLPPVASGGPQGSGPGALPAEHAGESTRFLGAVPAEGPGAPPPPQAAGDSDATQYLPPVPGQPYGTTGPGEERRTPAEFDNLFRSEAQAAGAAGATQHIPRYQQEPPTGVGGGRGPGAPVPPVYGGGGGDKDSYGDSRPQRSSKVPLIAAVVVGCAVLGLGAGALLSGGEEPGGDASPGTGTVAAGSPTPDGGKGSSPAPEDPAKKQAEALDKLLAESNDSRAAVIRSVESIKRCDGLDQAATDLRGAAGQRRGLVTKLQQLSVDKLPGHAELTSALTEAWQASARADDHYATWADQAKGRKICKGGEARSTGATAQANKASGEATAAKRKAAPLWNGIAGKYGLTPHQPEQL
ncbi:hypothetical protein [Streptomyces sp. NPDC046887]|uniref:hypothetical protein n=1 Tax=Streptomyces sp. NPDC046887 TaxID=3155472 RepID=UPI0033C4F475